MVEIQQDATGKQDPLSPCLACLKLSRPLVGCCALSDAWIMVRTGGRDDVRTCYLKDSLQRDPNIASFAYSYAPPYLHKDWPQVHISLIHPIQKSIGRPCL